MNKNRIKILQEGKPSNGPVVYWMQREQRVNDNWALIYAYEKAKENNERLIVVFNLVTNFLQATLRQYYFMIEGLKEVEKNLAKLNIPFILLTGKPEEQIAEFVKTQNASLLITDFNPLKIITSWKEKVNSKISIPFHQVDAHNIVPVWEASPKLEFAAYTIRPKINRLLNEYLDEYTKLKKLNNSEIILNSIDWDLIYKTLKIDNSVKPVEEFTPGENAANKVLQNFIDIKLTKYSANRNDPNINGVSNISPYLHFGQISAQRITLILKQFENGDESISSYLEELIIRTELSDNFCYYNSNYDNFDGFPDWAKLSLNQHRKDKREYVYTLEEFELAKTHDDLWNAAQLEMLNTGKMHGYMRMYWAKKILEWTKFPEQAMEFGIYLNDKYELDGRDPNGYVGLAWSIGGVHDRAWGERHIFGKVRYMNNKGCKRKFDDKKYINKYVQLDQQNLF
ncbi:MAG: deoxyribodipyrimidine photo-lyase [Ignavibacteriales bacterium]|nr:deoxyribodipyrimidine photo-lyase [Ignavibacteriales bacterium]